MSPIPRLHCRRLPLIGHGAGVTKAIGSARSFRRWLGSFTPLCNEGSYMSLACPSRRTDRNFRRFS
eukprot:5732597-Karenia_brevis.AAC.1